jgi:choice-of-anchor A domain-containing protein
MKNTWTLALASFGAAGLVHAQTSQLSVYNLIVSDTVAQANHVYGRAIVQNINLYTASGNNMEVGAALTPGNSYGFTSGTASSRTLQVGGSVSIPSGQTVRVMRGSGFLDSGTQISSTTRSRFSIQQSGASLQLQNPANGAQSTFDSVFNAISTESSQYAQRSANSTVVTSGNNATFRLSSSANDRIAVFNLSQSQATSLFNSQSIAQIQFDLNGRQLSSIDAIIVNVAGFNGSNTDFTAGQANFVGSITSDLALRSRLLWNFSQINNDLYINRNWYGSILAPQGFLQGSSNIDGSVAVRNICFNAEIHGPLWTGVPEASTYAAAAFVTGLGGWVAWRRRKAAARVAPSATAAQA